MGAAQVNANDDWIISGTFMAFIRIVIDLPNWWKAALREQELMIGRDKTTGCPIIGIDKNNIPLKDKRCPVTGSKEVTDKGNEIFRDHPAYGQQKLPAGISDDVLKTSHIGAMRILDKVSPWEAESNRIYRQGYEFLESTSSFPGFKAGLNFISFQNNPQRVFNIMTKWGMQKNSSDSLKLNRYFSVVSAGVFLVPPSDLQDRFPGSSIYFKDQIAKRNQQEWQPSPKYSERFRIR